MKKLYFILFLLLCSYVFFCLVTIDPDFGWRIRMGKLIVSQGIPKTDPFSFTMMKYPFVDHEWLTHVGIFLIYGLTNNNLILSALFGLIAVISLYKAIVVKNNMKKSEWFVPALIFLIGSSLFGAVGIRPQVWGWLLFIFWISELRKGSGANFPILCLIQLIWVNTHGSFFLGIGTFALYIISEYIQKKVVKKHIKKFIILLCVTIINPYGWRAWWEVGMQLSDSQLHWRVQEWMPSILTFNTAFWFYSVFFFSLLIKNWRKVSLFEKILSLLFFLSALTAIRNIFLFLMASVPLCIQMWYMLEKNVVKQMERHFLLFKNTLIILFFFIGFARIGKGISQISPINKEYPVNAVSFLLRNKVAGKIYTKYGWGGYLIWKVPNLKVFIDGRMPSWRWKQDDPKQSNSAEEEYVFITTNNPPFEPYRKKYDITYALIGKEEKKNIFVKYKKIYEDDLSILYKL